jgi:steroid 5-alpha reductase family enzyme
VSVLPILLAGGVLWLLVSLLWLKARRSADASILDIAWGPAVWLGGALAAASAGWGWPPRTLLGLGLGAAWALRLALHIARRHRRLGEDPRYRAWREAGGSGWFRRAYLRVFLLQGALALVVALPLAALGAQDAVMHWTWLDGLGTALVLSGLVIEGLADRQLAAFRADPANGNRVLDRGLWAWSRHPNYFGEALLWWGLGLIGLAAGPWWTLAGSLTITILLMRVSGVPLLEKRLQQTRPGYAEYARRTSAFLPWPPQR